ncbi:hypothetical protein [Microbacterium candidum]|uniref:Uncharacterized protein n=1 Tax=Microbacterium candidum TaxID=3041922 RepID=A0ABT7MVT3_9MICO|nr:hypothetical protein [Microbacterium sp. ASV49]MDL9978523.1 hypothetical protein [Microbacterium sp. ASV49]
MKDQLLFTLTVRPATVSTVTKGADFRGERRHPCSLPVEVFFMLVLRRLVSGGGAMKG